MRAHKAHNDSIHLAMPKREGLVGASVGLVEVRQFIVGEGKTRRSVPPGKGGKNVV